MELRPMRAALLAGRVASRFATSTTPTIASRPFFRTALYAADPSRSFSSTRLVRQEAEAPAPHDGGMSSYMRSRVQQNQQRQQQQQSQVRSPLSPEKSTSTTRSNDIFDPAPTKTRSQFLNPWGNPQKAQTGVTGASGSDPINDLLDKDLSWATSTSSLLRPNADDVQDDDSRRGFFWENLNKRKLRLRPLIGRTIEFQKIRDPRGRDLASGLSRLAAAVRMNQIKQDHVRQKFHERPGMRKKRQKTERWVRRFRAGFQATCRRVTDLARQGW